MTNKLIEADREVSEFFTSALGVRAQQYDPAPQSGTDMHDARMAPGHRRELRRFQALEWTMSKLDAVSARVLVAVYAPHSWQSTWTVDKLRTPWGNGNMAVLATTLPSVASGRVPLRTWLVDIDRPSRAECDRREAICKKLVEECEALRQKALAVYDGYRLERLAMERMERLTAERIRAEQLEINLGIIRTRRARLRGAA